MTLPSFTTGSGEVPAACFVDGETAYSVYGATKRYAVGCPNCRAGLNHLLSYNPTDSYYYLHCPICNKIIKYCESNGNLVQTFSVMKSTKTTRLDVDDDFPCHTGTF